MISHHDPSEIAPANLIRVVTHPAKVPLYRVRPLAGLTPGTLGLRAQGKGTRENKKPSFSGLHVRFRGDAGARTHVEGFADPCAHNRARLLCHAHGCRTANKTTLVRLSNPLR
jgi:hypothetical protein